MADFRYLSDSDTDKEESAAVEELISQAKDLCVLEQVAAIRCSSFTDSVLPTDLESRFRKLKSFPLTNKPKPKPKPKPNPDYSSANADFSLSKTPSNPKSPPDFSVEKGVFSDLEENPDPVSKHGSSKSPSGSTSSMDFSPSPPKKTGCFFWLSPKKASSHDHHHQKKKSMKSKENGLDWDMNHEFLSDLSTFSTKKQQKMLKKAMKEEEKISREAQKIVNWAKQSSARLSVVSGIHDDELSDSN